MAEDAYERDIERALTQHITRFLLELGTAFAFCRTLVPARGRRGRSAFLPSQAEVPCRRRTQDDAVQARIRGPAELLPVRDRRAPSQSGIVLNPHGWSFGFRWKDAPRSISMTIKEHRL
ncbi:DUF1016 family protein [Paraburkholderia sp. UYCP14C]|nr:DUF1016 family protein [Paraburkholderia sp. UYCP14C]